MGEREELQHVERNLWLGLFAILLQLRQVQQQKQQVEQTLCGQEVEPIDTTKVDRLTASLGIFTLFDRFCRSYATLKETEKTTVSYCGQQQELWFSAIIILISVIQFFKLFELGDTTLTDEVLEESIDELII